MIFLQRTSWLLRWYSSDLVDPTDTFRQGADAFYSGVAQPSRVEEDVKGVSTLNIVSHCENLICLIMRIKMNIQTEIWNIFTNHRYVKYTKYSEFNREEAW